MRKLLCSLTALVLLGLQTFAQSPCDGLGIDVEVVTEHDYSTGDPLEALNGMTTYRLYVTTNEATDFVSAIAGDVDNPVGINTTTSFFQEPTVSVLTGDQNNEAFYAAFPLQQYDSWVTIGRATSSDAGGDINAVAGLTDWSGNFEAGGDLVIDDAIGGSWFALNGDVNGLAGDDQKVLLGQFTTDGDFSGNVYVQIFPNSVGADEYRCNLEFAYVAEDVLGCTDDAACNFDPEATEDDGSCVLPDGCTNGEACNYDPAATCDDGSCVVVIAGELMSLTDGNACAGDGEADVFSFNYETFNAEGTSTAWVVTDLGANILDIIPSVPMVWDMVDIDFDGYEAGEVLVWYITYTELFNVGIGENAGDLEGCFDLSNPVSVEIGAAGCTNPAAINYNADACGDDGSCIFDQGDCLVNCPADAMLDCGDDTSAEANGMPTLAGDCEDVTISMNEDVVDGDDCMYTITRSWDINLADGTVQTCTQVLTVTDTTGPVLIGLPDNVLVECIEDVPAPVEITAEDDCNGVDGIEIFTSETGFPVEECVASTAYGLGDDWAIWLPVLETSGVALSDDFVPTDNISFVRYNDGTAHVSGTVVNNMNPAQGFIIDFYFQNEADWTAWDAAGRSYKDDAGFAAAGGDLWTTWTYYEMVNGFSTLTGIGDFEGSVLYMSHMPSNYYFGFQCGEAANNKNGNFGMSGWFTYDGIINGESVSGHGDINVDKECTPSNEIPCVNQDEFTYMYRATDDCGNATMDSYMVIVDDTTAPEFTVVPEDLVVECDEVPVPLFEGVEAIDNCDCGVTIEYIGESDTDGDACNYSFTRTWAAFDCCGNRTDYIQIISVVDTVQPEFTFVPEDATYECDEEVVLEDATGVDNCQDVTIDVAENMIEGDCPQEYTLERTFTMTDGCTEPVVATQTITVVDTTAPVITNDFPIQTSAECDDIDSVVEPIFEDNCGEVTVTVEEQNQSGGCMGVLVRMYTAVDECGNTTTVDQYITILDTTPPVIVTPEDMTVECDEVPEAPGAEGADVSDNCALDVNVTFEEEIIPGDCENNYTIVWTWTAVDYCENMTEASITIVVEDTTNPVFVEVPADLTLECDEEVPSCEGQEVVAEDNCDDELVIECTDNIIDGDCPQEYTIQRIYRAYDDCGNQGVYMQTITIVDTTAPVFTEVAADVTIECDEAMPEPFAAADDNCGDVEITVEGVSTPGDCPQESTMVRTYTAMDECGNMSTATQTITIVDTTAPIFDAYEIDVEAPCDNVDIAPLTATDNCSDVEITVTETPVSGGCAGRIIRDYVATDECGNEATAQQIITLVDEVAPVFVEVPADVTYECDEVIADCSSDDVAVEDNCTEVEVSCADEIMAGDCPQEYTIMRTWTAIDACDNEATYTQTINVVDTTAPVFTEVAADVTIECDETMPEPFAAATDNCGDVEITVEGVSTPGDCPQESTMVRTYTATDECGNMSTATQTITIVDTTAPVVVSAPADVTIECDEDEPTEQPVFTDNCSEVSISAISGIVQLECGYLIERSWTASDDCGNETTVSQTITVVDTTAPVFDAYEIEVDAPCDNPEAVELTATDNCDLDVTVTYIDTPVSGGCAGRIIRDYVATDDCGNQTVAQQIINLIDEVAPVFVEVPADMTYECDEEIMDCASVEILVEDNCTEFTVSCSDEIMDGDCPQEYTIMRTWTAIDACDNESSYTQTINVVDTTAPVFTEVAEDVTIECDETMPEPFAAADDNCGDVEITVEGVSTPGDCPQASTMVRTYTAMDECGNMSTATQTITIVDTTAPAFTSVPADLELECDMEVPVVNATAEDNCGETTVTWEDYYDYTPWMAASNGGDGVVDFSDLPNGFSINGSDTESGDAIYTVAMTAVKNVTLSFDWEFNTVDGDGAGFDPFVYVINDEEFVAISDEDGADNQSGSFSINLDPGMNISLGIWATDDAFGLADVTVSNINFEINEFECPITDCFIRQFTAVDECGNAATANQNIVKVDTTAPVFTEVAADVTIECDEAMPEPFAAADDNCGDVEISVEGVTTPGDCPQESVMVRTYTAMDECGNMTTATQTITIVDTTAPEFTFVPADVTYECDVEFAIGGATAEDNCGETTVTFTTQTAAGDCPQESMITVTYTAEDECGNTSTATQVISIVDTTAPVFTEVAASVTIECDETMPEPFAAADDNCGDVEITVEGVSTPGDCPQESVMVRTYTAMDECGNMTTATQTITIVDTTAPVFTEVAADTTIECDEAVPAPFATADDNCGDVEITSNDVETAGECANNYTITRTYTAMDECGNTSTATQVITVEDTTAPVFTEMPMNISVQCADDVPAMEAPTATDNCGTPTVVCDEDVIEEDECGNYVSIITCTATDACGNSTQVSYTVTVSDVTAPELMGTPDAELVIDCDDDVPAPADVTAMDNCDDNLEVSFEEVILGDEPAEGSTADCQALTPEAFEDGEVCTGEEPWSLKLFNFNGFESALYSSIETNWVEYPDGSATLSGSVVSNVDPNRGWNISVEFENGMDWAGWSTQGFPTSYKDDCNESGDNHFDWTYYIMSAGATLTGWGDFEGATLNLAHAPSNYYYGYQVGVAANNVNVNYGGGGWFTYSGIFNGAEVNGSGDFAFDHDCCPQYSVQRTWCVADCSGNETCFTQLISFADLDGINPLAGDGNETAAFEPKGDFQITRITPNPAIARTMIEYYTSTNNSVRLAVYDMSGREVAVLFEGNVTKGETYRTDYSTAELESGMYTVRLSSLNHADYQKLVVTK
ncbi:MAG: T9SS type A sorting domain-containing protein [Flavobacteriales bacterium]|nr:T9SS type A sorting domain-containing protein [Flavobacteriales bacterium]